MVLITSSDEDQVENLMDQMDLMKRKGLKPLIIQLRNDSFVTPEDSISRHSRRNDWIEIREKMDLREALSRL